VQLPICITLPKLWGDVPFEKSEWGGINFLVGPNGTGKSLFAETLKQECLKQRLHVRLLGSDRLHGLVKQNYGRYGSGMHDRGYAIGQFQPYRQDADRYDQSGDALMALQDKLELRIRIEATLSDLFGRQLRLREEAGYLRLSLERTGRGSPYDLKEAECHGIKELITLLAFLHEDEYNCLIIDEPELHLHPQFQGLLLQEMRTLAGDPRTDQGKKCFFLVTHSPYFVDIRTIDDLRHCLVFRPNRIPACIDRLEAEDEHRLARLLPRLNTHHKQFFFSERPIFVEGYFDQQTLSLIQEKRGQALGPSGGCIIDVGGKDELDLFFRLCRVLDTDAQLIADLDAVLKGRLRQSVSEDQRCGDHVRERSISTNLMSLIGKTIQAIDKCLAGVQDALEAECSVPALAKLSQTLSNAAADEGTGVLDRRRYAFLVALLTFPDQINALLPNHRVDLQLVTSGLCHAIEAFGTTGVHILPRGELENHLPSYEGSPYTIADEAKSKVFQQERDFLLDAATGPAEVEERYPELVHILDLACRAPLVQFDQHLNYEVADWVHTVQLAFRQGRVRDIESLQKDSTVQWARYSRILDVTDFSPTEDGGFTCAIKFKQSVDPDQRAAAFSNKTVAAEWSV